MVTVSDPSSGKGKRKKVSFLKNTLIGFFFSFVLLTIVTWVQTGMILRGQVGGEGVPGGNEQLSIITDAALSFWWWMLVAVGGLFFALNIWIFHD